MYTEKTANPYIEMMIKDKTYMKVQVYAFMTTLFTMQGKDMPVMISKN